MIVDHASRLHKSITNGTADKLKTSLLKVLAHQIGYLRRNRNIRGTFPSIVHSSTINELPDIAIKAAKFSLYRQKSLGVGDS